MKKIIVPTDFSATFKMHWTFLILLAWVIGANAVTGLGLENIVWSLAFIMLVFFSVITQQHRA